MSAGMSEPRWPKLRAAIEAGDQGGVLDALEGAGETERASIHALLVQLEGADDTPVHERSELARKQWSALNFAAARTVPADRLDQLAIYSLSLHPTAEGRLGLELLGDRPAHWRNRWRQRILASQGGSIGSLLVAVREGYCDAPERPLDPEDLAQTHANFLRLARDVWGKDVPLGKRLSDAPWALTWPIDLLFELEGGGEASLAACDKYLPEHATWSTAFQGLLASGVLDRERIIDATLRAMGSDFAPFRAGWFQRFFRGLALTEDEAVARTSVLFGLLASPVPATATTVLEGLSQLGRAGQLPLDGFIRSVGPCLLHKAKKTPILALKMLAAIAKAEPSLAPQVGEVAALGLGHPHTDVQAKALKLTESLSDQLSPKGRQRVAEAAPFLSATLTGGSEPASRATAFQERPAAAPLPGPLTERAPHGEPIPSIESMEELVLEAVQHLESAEDLIREERLLDAMLRRAAPPTDSAAHGTFRNAAMRALKKSPGESYGSGHIAACQFAAVILGWLTLEDLPGAADVNKNHMGTSLHPGMGVLRSRRSSIVQRFRSKGPERLWSLPTHADGSIESKEAKSRWAECNLATDDPDRLTLWARACTELSPCPPMVEVHAELRVSTRGSKPYYFSCLVPDSASTVQMPSVPGLFLLPSESEELGGWRDTHSLPDPLHMRSAASLCIRYPEVAMTLAARALASNLDFDEARWANRHFLEPLLWPDLTFGPLAHLALALGLAAKETQEKAIATDACIEAAQEGRVHATALGAEIARLLATRLAKPQRWKASLTEVAAASPSHGEFVARAVTASLELDVEIKPRGMAALLELLVEVQAIAGTSALTDGARSYLESFKGSSKAAKLAKALLNH